MPAKPPSLSLDLQAEERDIGESSLTPTSSPTSSATIGILSRTPRTSSFKARSPLTSSNVFATEVHRPLTPDISRVRRLGGLEISGSSLPASLTRSNSFPRRISRHEQLSSDIGAGESDAGFSVGPGCVKLNVLPIGLDPSHVSRIQRWITCIVIVDFDIDLGPVISAVYPPIALAPSDVSNIAFSSFPDSPQFEEGSQMHSFRVRCSQEFDFRFASTSTPLIPSSTQNIPPTSSLIPPTFSPIPVSATIPSAPSRHTPSPDPSSHGGLINGFSYFTQRKDSTMRRGYRQRAITIITPHQYPALFSSILSILGPIYDNDGSDGDGTGTTGGRIYNTLRLALLDWERWPDPTPGDTLLLNFFETEMEVDLPQEVDEQRFWTGPSIPGARIYIPAAAPSVYLASASPFSLNPHLPHNRIPPFLNAIPPFAASSLLPNLWAIWENLVLCEPILVCGDSPAIVSGVVWWIVEFGRGLPLSHSHDIRPYVTINDSDCSALINAKRPGKAGLVLGVTNPWLEKQCMHWGCTISVRGVNLGGHAPDVSVRSSRGHTPIMASPIGTPSSVGSATSLQAGMFNNGKSTPVSADTRKTRFLFGLGAGSDPADGGSGASGWKSRSWKRYISKDRPLLKKHLVSADRD